MSFSHGVCGFESVGRVNGLYGAYWVHGVYGVYGFQPAHPRGTRVRRRSCRRYRPADSIHQEVGAVFGVLTVVPAPVVPVVVPVVVPWLAIPPTTEVLSGVNRTS
jgi:hypothetical protein